MSLNAGKLALGTLNLPLNLGDPLTQDRCPAVIVIAARLELIQLTLNGGTHVAIVLIRQHRMVESDRVRRRTLGIQARFRRREQAELAQACPSLGPRPHIFEHDKEIPGLDPLALADAQLPDDAALEVLNRLPAAFGTNNARRDRGAGQRRRRRPDAADDKKQRHGRKA